MSVKILLYTLLKQIGIFLVVSFLVFRGTFVESDSLGLNLSTGVSLLLSVILWGICILTGKFPVICFSVDIKSISYI